MTLTESRPTTEAAARPEPAPTVAAPPAARALPWVRPLSSVLTLILALLLGFAAYVYGLSALSESRSQNTMVKSFTKALGEAVAPVGPTTTGEPVAILSIPAIGVHNLVVVEGTDARATTRGPGHRRDTPLPGQAGVSVVYGRRVMFGAPFRRLMQLVPGDVIDATTGQGTARYVVSSFGNGRIPAPANSTNRLVLSTADSSGWPTSSVTVSADLTSAVQPSGGTSAAIDPRTERSMRNDAPGSVVPLLLWAQLLLLVAILGSVATHRWSRWPAWLCVAPLVVLATWNVYENASTALFPNLF